MNQPKNWENTSAYGEFEPLELGGHICKIVKVEETKSRTNKDMIIIYIDIAEGEQSGYFRKMFDSDTRPEKRWANGGRIYQLIEDADGNTNRGFKTFINAVKKSNAGFDDSVIWNDKFATFFSGKLIGCIFGREQYIKQNGKMAFATKIFDICDTERIRKGVDVPADKLLNNAAPTMPGGYTPAANDDDCPF